ncbi:hypothetical protein CC78DRAFT_532832 [Lojkania enalia]|uniref:WKF domain-containing protein n=1 Tax=Lojkania enalia TaxID=147567 RepID=A0A9P4N6P4_9PLEO|nr:hypothetical protein CC78DRAFT_532832 [Didymosphaeria enalia]
MDLAGSRLPAWRRLGLTLKSVDQSGDIVSDSTGPESLEQPYEAVLSGEERKDIHRTVEPTPNGKPSSLGKRKPNDNPAEGHFHAFKKNKRSEGHEQANGNAAAIVLNPSKEENGVVDSRMESALTADILHPKGDPNYRKKKGRQINSLAFGPTVPKRHQDDAQRGPMHSAEPLPHKECHKHATARSPSPGTFVVSTETDLPNSPVNAAPRKATRPARSTTESSKPSALAPSPPRTDRRKSVTFTPDTKTNDGNSASVLFKEWVAEQKGASDDTEFTPAEVAQFAAPPKVHPANQIPVPEISSGKEEKEVEQSNKKRKKKHMDSNSPGFKKTDLTPQAEEAQVAAPASTPGTAKISKSATKSAQQEPKSFAPRNTGKKKDPSIYLSYLSQYHSDRDNWKFNKAKQNDVLENTLNVFRIPEEYSDALTEYIKGLKGAGVITRLIEKCNDALNELDKEEGKAMSTMDDPEIRKAAEEVAFKEHLAKQKKRRRTDADVEALANHPYPEGFLRRLKRHRAVAVLSALRLATPAPVASKVTQPSVTVTRNSRKRKSRTNVSSDESSSESSSSDESSSSADSDSKESDGIVSVSNDSDSDKASSGSSDEDDSSEPSSESASESSGSDEDLESSSASDSGLRSSS